MRQLFQSDGTGIIEYACLCSRFRIPKFKGCRVVIALCVALLCVFLCEPPLRVFLHVLSLYMFDFRFSCCYSMCCILCCPSTFLCPLMFYLFISMFALKLCVAICLMPTPLAFHCFFVFYIRTASGQCPLAFASSNSLGFLLLCVEPIIRHIDLSIQTFPKYSQI